VVAFLLVFLLPASARSVEGLSMGGYVKNFSTAYILPNYQQQLLSITDEILLSSLFRLHLDARYRLSNRITIKLAYNLLPRIQDELLYETDLSLGAINPRIYRAADLDARIHPAPGEPVEPFALFQNLDRAMIQIAFDDFDFWVGRQPIAWGSARVVNPTDVLAPFLYTELDTEERVGIDAARWRIPIGALNELDFGFVAAEDFNLDQSAFFLRTRLYRSPTDFAAMLVGFQGNLMAGVDIARPIGGAGFWFEAAQVWVDALENAAATSYADYFRVSIGVDYSFRNNTYVYCEYHFNGPGSNDVDPLVTGSEAFTEGGVYLLGKHYLAPGAVLQLTPLTILSVTALAHLGDPSVLLSPSLERDLFENVYLSAGAFVGLGKAPSITFLQVFPILPPQPLVTLRSEFGSYTDLVYITLRYYY
jgi:hypothetical protein